MYIMTFICVRHMVNAIILTQFQAWMSNQFKAFPIHFDTQGDIHPNIKLSTGFNQPLKSRHFSNEELDTQVV